MVVGRLVLNTSLLRWQVFDKNSDGYIDEQELQQTMNELGVKLTSDDVAAMFTEAGCKDQRRITYEGYTAFSSLFALVVGAYCVLSLLFRESTSGFLKTSVPHVLCSLKRNLGSQCCNSGKRIKLPMKSVMCICVFDRVFDNGDWCSAAT